MYCHSASFFPRGDAKNRNYQTPFSDLGELEQPAGFRHGDALDFSNTFSLKSGHVGGVQFGGLDSEARALGVGLSSSATGNVDADQLVYHRGLTATTTSALPLNGHFENWADSGMVDSSQQTDTSTDVETEDRTTNQFPGGQSRAFVFVDCLDQIKEKPEDPKALRRLAQNREAARKSRMRKKAYVQQLENSQLKLCQMEQELQHVRQQNVSVATGFSGGQSHSPTANGTLAFDMDYARWLDDHRRLINDLRVATYSEVSEHELRYHVNGVMAHYEEIFKLKSTVAKTDVFHILTGMWETPVERFFMWLGGFRSSELLKIIGNRIEPLTDQQLMGICNLQQSSQQAEDALSQGMEALQQSLVETLSSASLASPGSGNVADYMGQMAIAMGKLATLENFIHQADLLRQQTLQQMQRILTTRQAARALLVISDYVSRLRALNSLWVARPRE